MVTHGDSISAFQRLKQETYHQLQDSLGYLVTSKPHNVDEERVFTESKLPEHRNSMPCWDEAMGQQVRCWDLFCSMTLSVSPQWSPVLA